MEDSDDDLPPSDPIPYGNANDRSKKPRMAAVFSDVEEDGEEEPAMNSFAKRLTKYQKSPAKSKSSGMSSQARQPSPTPRCCFKS